MVRMTLFDQVLSYLYDYMDLLWLPIAWFAAHKPHRVMALGFVLACAFSLRMEVEVIESTGHPIGFTPYLDMPAFERGLIANGVFIAVFLILSRFSPGTRPIVYFSAALSIYSVAACVSMAVMAI